MKKKLIIIIPVIIIGECIIILSILSYLTFFKSSAENNIDTFKENGLKSKSAYNIKADIDVSNNIIKITEDITFKKAENKVIVYVPSANIAKTNIKKIYPEKEVNNTDRQDTTLEINYTEPQSNIRIEYEIILDNGRSMLSYSNNFYYLTDFLITPSVYIDGKPILTYKSEFGDPYIYEMNNYYIMFKTDKALNICAPGQKEEHIFGANKLTTFEAVNMRDFPAVIFATAQLEKKSFNNKDIYYINSIDTKEYVEAALSFGEKNIGEYPYDELYVVKAPISQNGMEFSNMIFLSDSGFDNKEYLKMLTYHEILHQWFYGIIGTDQLNEPFLDEGLVNYLSMLLGGSSFADTYNSAFFKMHLNDYTSRAQYYDLAYNNSTTYFHTIHKKLGNNFYELLNKIYEEKKFKIIYFKDFLNYVSKY